VLVVAGILAPTLVPVDLVIDVLAHINRNRLTTEEGLRRIQHRGCV